MFVYGRSFIVRLSKYLQTCHVLFILLRVIIAWKSTHQLTVAEGVNKQWHEGETKYSHAQNMVKNRLMEIEWGIPGVQCSIYRIGQSSKRYRCKKLNWKSAQLISIRSELPNRYPFWFTTYYYFKYLVFNNCIQNEHSDFGLLPVKHSFRFVKLITTKNHTQN